MLITEWNLEEAQRAWLAQGRDEGRNEGIEIGVGKGENNIVALLKSGKSPEDIIREFETKTVTAMRLPRQAPKPKPPGSARVNSCASPNPRHAAMDRLNCKNAAYDRHRNIPFQIRNLGLRGNPACVRLRPPFHHPERRHPPRDRKCAVARGVRGVLRKPWRGRSGGGRGGAGNLRERPQPCPVLGAPSPGNVPAAAARLWLDRRAVKAAERVSALAGGFVDAGFFLPKALDIKTNEPDLYEKTKVFLGCPELLAYALTGEARTSFPSDGFERWFWTDAILEALGLDGEKFPPFIRPGEAFGRLAAPAASRFGLNPGILVISGGSDFIAAILGSGAISPGQACNRTGTSDGINACTKARIDDGRLMSYGHPVRPFWNLSGIVSTTGKAVEWARNLLGAESYDEFFRMAQAAKPGSGGLVFCPTLPASALRSGTRRRGARFGGLAFPPAARSSPAPCWKA